MKSIKKLIPILLVCNAVFNSCKKDSSTTPQIPPLENKANSETITLDMKDGTVLQIKKIGDDYLLAEDIILSAEQFQALKRQSKSNTLTDHGTFLHDVYKVWPQNTVYYVINNSININAINYAITQIQNSTTIKFVQRTNQPNYIEFIGNPTVAGAAGQSFVGMIGGRQYLRLANNVDDGTIMHEICHALGMFHEHTRSDRDTYINVNYGNINSTWKPDYDTYVQRNLPGSQFGSFDFESIMLYSSKNIAAAINSNPAPQLTKKDGSIFYGQRYYLSQGDINTLNYLYSNNYLRLRYVSNYGIHDQWQSYEEGTFYIDVYNDYNHTSPKTLPNDVTVIIQVHTSNWWDDLGMPTVSRSTFTATIPAGSSSYLIHSGVYDNQNFTYDGMTRAGSSAQAINIEPGYGYNRTNW